VLRVWFQLAVRQGRTLGFWYRNAKCRFPGFPDLSSSVVAVYENIVRSCGLVVVGTMEYLFTIVVDNRLSPLMLSTAS
jgi:hypothetical protein